MFKFINIAFAFLVLFILGCTNDKNNASKNNIDINLDSTIELTLELSSELEEDIIFYNMLYPIDLGVLIDKRNSYYNSNLLNPLNNISKYNESSKMALALGVYGADLSYLWVFKQAQQALSYFTAIKQLAGDLGIPNEYVSISANKAEMYTDNIDTLVNIARKAYYDCDVYLIEQNQQDLAVLVLLGGWIETMHTAINLYTQPNNRMACKIISQKYSLTSLLNLLYEQPDNLYIANYSNKLAVLLEEFDRLQNNHFSDHLAIDTLNKTITFNASKKLDLNPEEFDILKEEIVELRKLIIQ